ncbi:hypothetical protein Q7P35_005158 [Cladosporium inversicolor]
MTSSLPTILKGCALFNLTMGTLNLTLGQNMLADTSVFTPGSSSSALADSQIRYLGGILAGSGAIVWWASNDILHRRVPLACVGLGIFAGGLGRWVAGLKHGFGPKTKVVMWVELVAPVVLYLSGRVAGQW